MSAEKTGTNKGERLLWFTRRCQQRRQGQTKGNDFFGLLADVSREDRDKQRGTTSLVYSQMSAEKTGTNKGERLLWFTRRCQQRRQGQTRGTKGNDFFVYSQMSAEKTGTNKGEGGTFFVYSQMSAEKTGTNKGEGGTFVYSQMSTEKIVAKKGEEGTFFVYSQMSTEKTGTNKGEGGTFFGLFADVDREDKGN